LKSKSLHILLIGGVNICRLILGIVFIFSGFVKSIDPLGTQYKIEDYLEAFNLQSLFPSFVPLLLSIGIALLEFMVGVFFVFGIRRKFATIMAFIMMLFYTPLTLYIAISNPVKDCGCFGDALIITNWQTFYKNVILLLCVIIVWKYKRYIVNFFVQYC
jgi:uncharacterized membrane protein YphA (DoxX/SURF4 family)